MLLLRGTLGVSEYCSAAKNWEKITEYRQKNFKMPQYLTKEPYREGPYLGGGRNFSSFLRYLATVSATSFFRAYNS